MDSCRSDPGSGEICNVLAARQTTGTSSCQDYPDACISPGGYVLTRYARDRSLAMCDGSQILMICVPG